MTGVQTCALPILIRENLFSNCGREVRLLDTGTHFVMGIALGGLATLDPVIAQSPVTASAVIAGTILGSQAPDIDTVLKLRNNAVYIHYAMELANQPDRAEGYPGPGHGFDLCVEALRVYAAERIALCRDDR